jgi:hypothetical protein
MIFKIMKSTDRQYIVAYQLLRPLPRVYYPLQLLFRSQCYSVANTSKLTSSVPLSYPIHQIYSSNPNCHMTHGHCCQMTLLLFSMSLQRGNVNVTVQLSVPVLYYIDDNAQNNFLRSYLTFVIIDAAPLTLKKYGLILQIS